MAFNKHHMQTSEIETGDRTRGRAPAEIEIDGRAVAKPFRPWRSVAVIKPKRSKGMKIQNSHTKYCNDNPRVWKLHESVISAMLGMYSR